MRTMWEQVNQDLVEYRERGFATGYEVGIAGMDLPYDVIVLMRDKLDYLEFVTFEEGAYAGHAKGANTFASLHPSH